MKTIVNLIGSTTTEKGLSVICHVDENHYGRGKKITEEQKEELASILEQMHMEQTEAEFARLDDRFHAP